MSTLCKEEILFAGVYCFAFRNGFATRSFEAAF